MPNKEDVKKLIKELEICLSKLTYQEDIIKVGKHKHEVIELLHKHESFLFEEVMHPNITYPLNLKSPFFTPEEYNENLTILINRLKELV